MSDELEVPEEFADALASVGAALGRLRQTLTVEMIADDYVQGFNAAGYKAQHATNWIQTRKGGYPKALPLGVDVACPFGHRDESRTDWAKVRFIVEDSGRVTLDPASPCSECLPEELERWQLRCPRCAAGEDSERHYPDHVPLDVFALYDFTGMHIEYDYDDRRGGFDASPLAEVVRALARRARKAQALWWIEHTEAAARESPGLRLMSEVDRQRFVSDRLAWARSVLDAEPRRNEKITATPARPSMKPEECADWLDAEGISLTGEKATWEAAKALAGCPAQSVVFAAVKVRKARDVSR